MILENISNLVVPLTEADACAWDLKFNKIGFLLADSQIASIKPLVAVFDHAGPRVFLTVASHLVSCNLRGALICWAWLYCQEGTHRGKTCECCVRNEIAS
jgi:hypothetical protein